MPQTTEKSAAQLNGELQAIAQRAGEIRDRQAELETLLHERRDERGRLLLQGKLENKRALFLDGQINELTAELGATADALRVLEGDRDRTAREYEIARLREAAIDAVDAQDAAVEAERAFSELIAGFVRGEFAKHDAQRERARQRWREAAERSRSLGNNGPAPNIEQALADAADPRLPIVVNALRGFGQ